MPNGMHYTPLGEEGSAIMQSPQPEDRVWQTGQWVSLATDPASFPIRSSEVLVEFVMQIQRSAYANHGVRCTITGLAGPA